MLIIFLSSIPIFFFLEHMHPIFQEDVLKQIRATGLYKQVMDILSSEKSCCQMRATLRHVDNLPEIAARICCQGAGFLAGRSGSSDMFCCQETCVRCYRATGDKPVTVVSGMVVNGCCAQGLDVLVPTSQMKSSCCSSCRDSCSDVHPTSNDVLTALLLALPPETWLNIKDGRVVEEINSLLSVDNLPPILQEEVGILFFCFVSKFQVPNKLTEVGK